MISAQEEKQNIIASSEYEMTYLKKRKAFLVDRKEWERLKRMLSNSIEPTNWFDRIIGFSFAALLGFVGFAMTLTQYAAAFYVAAGFSLVLFIIFIFFESRDRKLSIYNKKQILEYADEIEIKENDYERASTPTYKKIIQPWTSVKKNENSQGVDYLEIDLKAKLLKVLTFKLRSDSNYWRAGFKLVAPNAVESLPNLLTDKSFLFHVYRDDNGKYGLLIYHDGNTESAIQKSIHPKDDEITITIERDERNYVRCFVDNSLEYNKRFNPELFKKLFLVAWGDESECRVLFEDIAYSTE